MYFRFDTFNNGLGEKCNAYRCRTHSLSLSLSLSLFLSLCLCLCLSFSLTHTYIPTYIPNELYISDFLNNYVCYHVYKKHSILYCIYRATLFCTTIVFPDIKQFYKCMHTSVFPILFSYVSYS